MPKFSVSGEGEGEDEEEQSQNTPIRETIGSSKRKRASPTNSNPQRDAELGRVTVEKNKTASNFEPESVADPGSISVVLSDPDILDCSICFEPLSIPVYQCVNGHTACAPCCGKLMNKCPSCSKVIGVSRCRAIEKVIESLKIRCKNGEHGCKALVGYRQKHVHEETCLYAPCSCPFPKCVFRGSLKNLWMHMSKEHSDYVVSFKFNSLFLVPLSKVVERKFVALLEDRDCGVFLLVVDEQISVKCVQPVSEKGRFTYDLIIRGDNSSIRFQARTENTTGPVDTSHMLDSLVLPAYEVIQAELCIWSKDTCCVDINKAIQDD